MVVLVSFKLSRKFFEASEVFYDVLVSSEAFKLALNWFWKVTNYLDGFYNVLRCSEAFRDFQSDSKKLLHVLTCSLMFWSVMRCSEALSCVLSGSLMFLRCSLTFWAILRHFETFPRGLSGSERFLNIMNHSLMS